MQSLIIGVIRYKSAVDEDVSSRFKGQQTQ